MTQLGDARDDDTRLRDLAEAARLLGCDLSPEAVPPPGQDGGPLVMAAVVLGAAEAQMVNAESEILQLGGTVADIKSAADVSALVTTAGDPWSGRRWLLWHASRLIHQLYSAEGRGALPPKVGGATARCVYAVHHLLVELADGYEDHADLDRIPARAVTPAREELLTALNELAGLASDDDGRD